MPVSWVAAITHTGLPSKVSGRSPDAQVMALREGVVDLFEDQVGRLAFQQQDGDGSFLIAALLGDGAEGFELGLGGERARRCVHPASLNACCTCSCVPISMRLVTSLGLEGLSAMV